MENPAMNLDTDPRFRILASDFLPPPSAPWIGLALTAGTVGGHALSALAEMHQPSYAPLLANLVKVVRALGAVLCRNERPLSAETRAAVRPRSLPPWRRTLSTSSASNDGSARSLHPSLIRAGSVARRCGPRPKVQD